MASGFFALFDDIAYMMDDVAVASKIATKKTASILGDDLAVSAKQSSGYVSNRELPVIWAITKGSFLNKLIILPGIFLLNFYASWSIKYLLMLGGIYLAYEGVEKIYEYLFHKSHHNNKTKKLTEKQKIRGAIMTDFVLSVEIIIIALSAVIDKPFMIQLISVTFTAFIATLGVYGLVALIVRMDDVGIYLIKKYDGFIKKLGEFLVSALPKVIKSLAVIGTIAMLLVAGGIYMHNLHFLHENLHFMPSLLAEVLVGLCVGIIAFIIIEGINKIRG